MSILHRIPKKQIPTLYTHKGWFYMCPIYMKDPFSEAPLVTERNWVPEFWLDLMNWIHFTINSFLPPDLEYDFPFTIEPLEND